MGMSDQDLQAALAAANQTPGANPHGPMSGPDPMAGFRSGMGVPSADSTLAALGVPQAAPPGAPSPNAPLQQRFATSLGMGQPPIGAPVDQALAARMGPDPLATQSLPGGVPLRQGPDGGAPPAGVAAPAPARAGGGGGGGDFGIGKTEKDLQAARGKILTGLEQEKADQQKLTEEQTVKQAGLADVQEVEAKRQAGIAEDQKAAASTYQQTIAGYQAETNRMNEEIRQQKVDPSRLFGSASNATKFSFVLSAAIDGMVAGRQGQQGNATLDRMNKMIDQDVATQNANYERQKDYLSQRNTIYGQMRQAYGDAQLANTAYAQAMRESAKTQIQATTDRLGIPELAAKGQLLSDSLDNHINDVNKGFADDAHRVAVQRANAAAAALAAARAANEKREQQAFDNSLKLAGVAQHDRELSIQEDKASREGGNKDQKEIQHASREWNRQVDTIASSPVIDKLGYGLSAKSGFGQRLAPDASQDIQELHNVNTRMLQGIGRVAKDADGKPNEAMIKELKDKFEIHPTDTPAIARKKLMGVREAVNALDRQRADIDAPEPGKTPIPAGFTPDAPR